MAWLDSLLARISGHRPADYLKNAGAPTSTSPVELPSAGRRRPHVGVQFPQFHVTAGDQPFGANGGPSGHLRAGVRNAFTPTLPISTRESFAGRRDVLMTLIGALEDRMIHVVAFGERGIGKTSLLRMLAVAAREARYLVVYISCSANSSFDEVFRSIASQIPLLYHEDFGPRAPESEQQATFASLISTATITVNNASELLSKVVGTRVIVILDEFDRSSSQEFRYKTAELLKSLSDLAARVQFVVAGVASNLTELVEHLPSSQRNLYALEIPSLTEAETRQIIAMGEAKSGLTFRTDAVTMVVTMSNGLPYLAHLICHYAGLAAVDNGHTTVLRNDVDGGVEKAIADLRGHLSRKSDGQVHRLIDEKTKRILGMLSGVSLGKGGKFTLEDIDRVSAIEGEQNDLRSKIAELAAENLIVAKYDDEVGLAYRFVDDNVPPYIWLCAALMAYRTIPSTSRSTM